MPWRQRFAGGPCCWSSQNPGESAVLRRHRLDLRELDLAIRIAKCQVMCVTMSGDFTRNYVAIWSYNGHIMVIHESVHIYRYADTYMYIHVCTRIYMCVGVGFTKSPFMDPQVVDESLKTKTRLFSAALGFGKTPNSTGGSRLVGKPGGAVHKGKFNAQQLTSKSRFPTPVTWRGTNLSFSKSDNDQGNKPMAKGKHNSKHIYCK